MIALEIKTISYPDCTMGRLNYKDFQCFTLELPWLDNQKSISCTPANTYRGAKHLSPSLGWVIHILDVEGRTWCYIHKGNFTYQIRGCTLVGKSITYLDSDSVPDVASSGPVFDELYEMLPDEFPIIIDRRFF